MTASTKLHQLESKISELQKQHQLLFKERQQEIASLIGIADLAHIDDKILMGGLLFLKEKITIQNPMMEVWHTAGEKFLRRTKQKSQRGDQQRKAGKQGNNFHKISKQAGGGSQASAQKSTSPNPNYPHQPTDQPLQKHPQSGEE